MSNWGSEDWREEFFGGSAEAEAAEIERALARLDDIQAVIARKNDNPIRRGFHNKGRYVRGEFEVSSDLDDSLTTELFERGRIYPALVRFSNSSSVFQGDLAKDQRGCGIRLRLDQNASWVDAEPGQVQDLTLSNTPTTFARDVRQFMSVGRKLAGNRVAAVFKILAEEGLSEGFRILRELIRETPAPRSHLLQSYWSRTPYQLGSLAVKYEIVPRDAATGAELDPSDDALARDLEVRLAANEYRFDFKLQFYQDEQSTPFEDSSLAWSTSSQTVGQLMIPRQTLADDLELIESPGIADIALNPWNTATLKPLGNLNRARQLVYQRSAENRRAR